MFTVVRWKALRSRLFVVGLGFVLACPAAAQSMSGKWFGTAPSQGGVSCWVNERRVDGSYELNFLVVRDGAVRRHREEGTWFSANGLYASITQRINGAATDPGDRRFREVYRVLELTARQFRYADISSGREFVVRRVADNFALGDACPNVT